MSDPAAQVATTVELVKLLPEGAATAAVIVTLVLMLRFVKALREDYQRDFDRVVASFSETVKAIREDSRASVQLLADRMQSLEESHRRVEQRLIEIYPLATRGRAGEPAWARAPALNPSRAATLTCVSARPGRATGERHQERRCDRPTYRASAERCSPRRCS